MTTGYNPAAYTPGAVPHPDGALRLRDGGGGRRPGARRLALDVKVI